MPRKRSTSEHIAFALRQAESGATFEKTCRKMGVPEIRRLKQLAVDGLFTTPDASIRFGGLRAGSFFWFRTAMRGS
jgi:hypothetical protein